ncbi:hypothetical protein BKA70DRAFT_1383184 [Coprinopsis sp. MPI-PUGE-AT-0042]|nr:hypothetical protein BKA70DRAFT_1383184 [Coprinopsis sp. MPI-PUGE-AT-0042]
MEKFSAYRDAGTGIQPFLTPLAAGGADILATASLTIRYPLAVIRTALVVAISLLYLVLVQGVCQLLVPISPVYDAICHLITAIVGRSALFVLGFFWIPVTYVSRKRAGRRNVNEEIPWSPKRGDVLVSNWASWVELVWLAIRFNPVFVLPVPERKVESVGASEDSAIAYKPGRRTGTGSANISQATKTHSQRILIIGFRTVSLWKMIISTGYAPQVGNLPYQTLEDIRRTATRPIVVFPECTTSNGRGLLRFADVFKEDVPVKGYNIFVASVRYDPPTNLAASVTHSIPSTFLNPLPHLFTLAMSLAPLTISIRLLPLADSPSSQLFLASEVLSGYSGQDQLSESCAVLVSSTGKLKRTGMGWEDKTSLLESYFSEK